VRNEFEKKLWRKAKRAKCKVEYEPERIPYILSGYYIPDFVLDTPLGKVYVEAKGYFRPEAKRKLVAVKKQHPELDLRIVFYTERTAYIKWATRHGFRYAIGTIPADWLKGL
jgi:predicted nuclease of restriction endonuclease-like RecB superfamily